MNDDGEVNISDVSILIDVMLGGEVSPEIIGRTDVNGDGEVNISDISDVIDYILK